MTTRRAERGFGGRDPRVHLVVREAQVFLRERLALPDALLLDLVQEFDVHHLSPGLLHPGWLTALRGACAHSAPFAQRQL